MLDSEHYKLIRNFQRGDAESIIAEKSVGGNATHPKLALEVVSLRKLELRNWMHL